MQSTDESKNSGHPKSKNLQIRTELMRHLLGKKMLTTVCILPCWNLVVKIVWKMSRSWKFENCFALRELGYAWSSGFSTLESIKHQEIVVVNHMVAEEGNCNVLRVLTIFCVCLLTCFPTDLRFKARCFFLLYDSRK